jgi:hypothetical protein
VTGVQTCALPISPDWESDSDETNEEDNNSSSSGEFIWKVCTWGLKIVVCRYRNGSLLQGVPGKIKGLEVRLYILDLSCFKNMKLQLQ